MLVGIASVALWAQSHHYTASVRDGVYTPAQARAGKILYNQRCSSCHLQNLAGGANESPALKGDDFVSRWQGGPLRALYSRIISTMPDNDPGTLSQAETLAVVAYILQQNGLPHGPKALQSASELNAIEFEAPEAPKARSGKK